MHDVVCEYKLTQRIPFHRKAYVRVEKAVVYVYVTCVGVYPFDVEVMALAIRRSGVDVEPHPIQFYVHHVAARPAVDYAHARAVVKYWRVYIYITQNDIILSRRMGAANISPFDLIISERTGNPR